MLVCPQCQSENPDTNKFCQQCGGFLTEKACPGCGASVGLDIERCPECGTVTGTILRAILAPAQSWQQYQEKLYELFSEQAVAQSLARNLAESSTPNEDSAIPVLIKSYLDAQQRYQFLEPVAEAIATRDKDIEVRVLDCQPFQISFLEALNHQTSSTEGMGELLTIPALARPYLEVQHSSHLLLPQLRDAWEQDGISILLLEERSNLPGLLELWANESILPLQILHWLHEMVDFWEVLQPQHCCESLLDSDNLRVDEDYLLCLQRLHIDSPEHPPQLQDLGRFWQKMFQQSQRTQIAELSWLCCDLETGKINSLKQVRSRIEVIATNLQSYSLPTPMTSESPKPQNTTPLVSSDLDRGTAGETQDLVEQSLHGAAPVSSSRAAVSETSPPDSLTPELVEEEITTDSDDLPTVVLPMQLINLEDSGRTDIGRQRDHNEDCYSIETEIKKLESPQGRHLKAKGLYILCDGMGGHAGGEVASALAVDTLRKYFEANWQDKLPNEEIIRRAVQLANQAIYDLNQQNARSGSGRMGTTLVLVLVQDTEAAIAHVGDSRLYRVSRRWGLEQITVDHEVGQREIQRGVEPALAYARPDAYQLTQALGPRDENFINPDVKFLELNEDMLLLLCSDGLTDNDLLELHSQSHLEPLLSPQANLEQGINQLIELANQFNGHDNITAIGIRARVRPNLDMLGPR